MSDTVTIRNKTEAAREIDGVGIAEPGGTIDVPAELANGTAPTGEEGTPEYRAGVSGLLAQEDVWEKAAAKRKTTDVTPSGEEA